MAQRVRMHHLNPITLLGSFLATLLILTEAYASTDILMITDSHGEGTFGTHLFEKLSDQGLEVSAFGVGGSTPRDWVYGLQQVWGYWERIGHQPEYRSSRPKTPQFSYLLSSRDPKTVIIVQGTNWIWSSFGETEKQEARTLISMVKAENMGCFWVGPPGLSEDHENTERLKAIHAFIENEVFALGCSVILSWQSVKYPVGQGDGIHYDAAGEVGKDLARQWAQAAFDNIKRGLP